MSTEKKLTNSLSNLKNSCQCVSKVCSFCQLERIKDKKVTKDYTEIFKEKVNISKEIESLQETIKKLNQDVENYEQLLKIEQNISSNLDKKVKGVQELSQGELQRADEQKILAHTKVLKLQADIVKHKTIKELDYAKKYIEFINFITDSQTLPEGSLPLSEMTKVSLWKHCFSYSEYIKELEAFLLQCEEVHYTLLSSLRQYGRTEDFKLKFSPKRPERNIRLVSSNLHFWQNIVLQMCEQIPSGNTSKISSYCPPHKTDTVLSKISNSSHLNCLQLFPRNKPEAEDKSRIESLNFVCTNPISASQSYETKSSNDSCKQYSKLVNPSESATSKSNDMKVSPRKESIYTKQLHAFEANKNWNSIDNLKEKGPFVPMSSAEKLVTFIRRAYPYLSKDGAYQYMLKVREENGGKLSGLSIPLIIRKIGKMLPKTKNNNIVETPWVCDNIHSCKLLSNVSVKDNQNHIIDHKEVEYPIDECSICFEDMQNDRNGTVTTLEPCGHSFHTKCIKQWFKEKRDCPFCRNFTLLKDEYPILN